MHARHAAAAILVLLSVACGSSSEDDATAGSAAVVEGDVVDAARVEAVIEKLRQQRESDPIGRYYEDGVRMEGCWRNPAGNKLTDLKKALYCSMPLEFRLCNTVVLLTVDESEVDARYRGYRDCKSKVDRVFGGRGMFAYDDEIDAIYKTVYLEGKTLAPADQARIVAAQKPSFSDRSFPTLLLAIGKSLTHEAVDLAVPSLSSMVDGYERAAGEEPR